MLKESNHTNGLALPPLAISIEYHLSQNKAITKVAHVDKPRAASTALNLLLHLVKTSYSFVSQNKLILHYRKQATVCTIIIIAKVFMPYWDKQFKILTACATCKPRCFCCCCTSVAQLSHFKIGSTVTWIWFPHKSAFLRSYMFIHVHTCKVGQRVHKGFI